VLCHRLFTLKATRRCFISAVPFSPTKTRSFKVRGVKLRVKLTSFFFITWKPGCGKMRWLPWKQMPYWCLLTWYWNIVFKMFVSRLKFWAFCDHMLAGERSRQPYSGKICCPWVPRFTFSTWTQLCSSVRWLRRIIESISVFGYWKTRLIYSLFVALVIAHNFEQLKNFVKRRTERIHQLHSHINVYGLCSATDSSL